jgi:hypothetical protein
MIQIQIMYTYLFLRYTNLKFKSFSLRQLGHWWELQKLALKFTANC